MFEEWAKVAVIGEKDTLFAFRALGIKTFSPRDVDEAREILKGLKPEKIALCFMHQRLLEPLREEREALGKKFIPVVVGFSDYRRITDHLENMMKEMAVKATGSDALVKRRGNHGTR
jgi:V/A-type H+-transporting ATPase subunit F